MSFILQISIIGVVSTGGCCTASTERLVGGAQMVCAAVYMCESCIHSSTRDDWSPKLLACLQLEILQSRVQHAVELQLLDTLYLAAGLRMLCPSVITVGTVWGVMVAGKMVICDSDNKMNIWTVHRSIYDGHTDEKTARCLGASGLDRIWQLWIRSIGASFGSCFYWKRMFP